MAPQTLTEYERKRLENMKRNEAMIASLKLQSRADELSSAIKRPRIAKKIIRKKPKSKTPFVPRSSLRVQGIAPDPSTAKGLEVREVLITPKIQPKPSIKESGCQAIWDLYIGEPHECDFVDTIKGILESEEDLVKSECDSAFEPSRMMLEEENIARVVRGRMLEMKFMPCVDRTIVVAGSTYGDLGFWDIDSKEDHDGVYLYHPHAGHISGISFQPFDISKIFTCCKNGFIRLMDVEKEEFEVICSTEYSIFSLAQRPDNAKSLYFGEGNGLLTVWDERAGKSSNSWTLHDRRINTIDFNSGDTNLMATGSSDGTACIWDLRRVNVGKPIPLMMASRERVVQSAYFSPNGSCLLTTSVDSKVGLMHGVHSARELNLATSKTRRSCEQKSLENVKQNEQMIDILEFQVKAEELSAANKIPSENKVGLQRGADSLNLSEICDSDDAKSLKPPTSSRCTGASPMFCTLPSLTPCLYSTTS
ncbi:hypothetical protein GIB67_016760 [Kingdonia uniflora]|uniref:Uncharacterized protein n=1 Tax=Kingdonia uniflora TaxID=39325 RepID=A0A7J7LXP9_9MAGN|nr:hypothetical protein GIB67_016760 [Kingdonia uniflora]